MKPRKLRNDENGSAGLAMFGLGILILIALLVIPSFLYDSPEDAWSEVKNNTVSAGVPVTFAGKVTSIRSESYTGLGILRVEGFGAPIYFRNSEISVGDEVVVDGRYFGGSYGGSSLGYVSGGSAGFYSALTPADVSHPWWKGGVCNIVIVIGIIFLILGILAAIAGL